MTTRLARWVSRFTALLVVFALHQHAAHAQNAPAPETGGAAFNAYENYDLDGPTLREIYDSDATKCEAACRGETKCAGFAVDKWARVCWLKSSVRAFRLDPRMASGIPASAPSPSTSDAQIVMECINDGLVGNELGGTQPDQVRSPEVCNEACEKSADCVAFQFDNASRACRLFASASGTASQSSALSGLKHQMEPGESEERFVVCRSPTTIRLTESLEHAALDRSALLALRADCSSAAYCPKTVRDALNDRFEILANEEKSYNAAAGNRTALTDYIVSCKACEFVTQAKRELALSSSAESEPEAAPPAPGASPPDAAESPSDAPADASPPATHLGLAVAIGNISRGRVQAWGSTNYDDADSAKTAAMNLCRAAARDCKVVGSDGPGCIAVAGAGRIWSVRGGETDEDASRSALETCNGRAGHCVVFAHYCNK